jgi:serine/threonine protein kinase
MQVKDELAGRLIRCPQCKAAMAIPALAATHDAPVAHSLTGDATAPPRASADPGGGPTVPPAVAPLPLTLAAEAHPPRNGEPIDDVKAEIVYRLGGEIARGGMGAIRRALDPDIRREVAVKFLLDSADSRQKARFLEEAQITGQLEHPNIVPIHQLGVHADGRCFFAMKMVKGRSLAAILKDEKNTLTLGQLLTIFVSICNAVAYAHSRKVIHRDLKPANVMVGDFGEVYVMDWGLAKVLGKEAEVRGQRSEGPRERVATSRAADADLTQAGAVLGTPAYMPPEQAQGADLDERADIYALGAILYEILTLTPPVGRDRNVLAILLLAVEGKIDPPAQRAPQRARAGWVPPELSAVAMKALARDRADRYPDVDSLRRDVERFLEGRSVSAKPDTIREQIWKLIKRNKTASVIGATAAVLLTVVVAWSWWTNYRAYQKAEKARQETEQAKQEIDQAYHTIDQANADLVKEKEQKDLRTRRAVPAFVQAAHALAAEGKFDDALAQLDYTLECVPTHAEARFLKGQILIAQNQFAEGRAELEKYLELKPGDRDAQDLVKLCAADLKDDLPFRVGLARVFHRLGEHTIAARLLEEKGNELKAREQLLVQYRKIIQQKWPGLGKRLSMKKDGSFVLDLEGQAQIDSLEPLRGMQLGQLSLFGCKQLTDLSPLRGMPLTVLTLDGCRSIRDFSPVKSLPLVTVSAKHAAIEDLSFLKGMMTLRILELGGNPIEDLAPLRGLQLTGLELSGCRRLNDLSPLEGMPLKKLELHSYVGSRVKDIRPLATLKDLQELNLQELRIKDLSPLKGLPLKDLNIHGNEGQPLAFLEGMPLIRLSWSKQHATPENVQIVRKIPTLKTVGYNRRDYSAADFLKRYDAGEFRRKPPSGAVQFMP